MKTVPLDTLGGLFTEASPESLPPGSSPRTINCDYLIGSVIPRPGKRNAFTFANDFFESTAPFTQSVGIGAPWSGGSVTLNGPAGGNPVQWQPLMSIQSGSGNTETWVQSVPRDFDGPCVLLLPAVFKSIGVGDQATIDSITDNAGGQWTQKQSKFSWSNSNGSSDPGKLNSFCFWVGVYPNGFPAGIEITINLNIPFSGLSDAYPLTASKLAFLGLYQFCDAIDQYAFQAFQPPVVAQNGPSITTTRDGFIVTISTIPVSSGVSAGFAIFNNGGATPALSGAYAIGGTPPFVQPAGTYQPLWTGPFTPPPVADILVATLSLHPVLGGGTGSTSQTLQALNFDLEIPVDIPAQGQVAAGCDETFHFITPPSTVPIFGIEVRLTGSQSNLSPDAELQVQLQLPDGTLSPETKTTQMPASTGMVTLGSPSDLWGFTADEINAALLNDPNFTVNIVAVAPNGETVTFNVSVEVLVAFTTPDPPPNINYLKTFEQEDGELFTLVLGSNGTIYREDVLTNPNVLTPVYEQIEPDSFAESCTQNDREFIAISDLQQGTDIPYGYDGTNFDRLSQVGPGAPPAATGSSTGGTIPIVSITQPVPKSDPENPGHLLFLWSAGPGQTTPGNVLTVYYGRSNPPGPLNNGDPDLVVGVGVTIAGADNPEDTSNPNNTFNGQKIDGNYVVTSVGEGIPPGAQYGRWYFTVQMAVSQFVNQANHNTLPPPANEPDGTYQVTTATVTTSSQVPNLQVGGKMLISGTGGSPPTGYDGSWVVTVALNAAQMQITSTQRSGGAATYGFALISGTAPTVGEQVTVGGTLNGNGIFNVANVSIQSVTAGSFSINLPGPDIPSAAELGTGIIFGTMFKFEPGQVVGTKTTGTLVVAGIFSVGQRKLCYSFLTRNGFLTQPSPIATVDVVIGSTGIAVSNLLTGPDDVIARVIHLTAANGGNFYNIPEPVIVNDPITGQTIVNDSTWIMDNVTTNIVLSFSDDVLLAADEIDIQGNNLFEDIELGSCTMLIPYASRLFAIGEQNKVFNFLNWSFDGGIVGGPGGTTAPAGWTVDSTNGAGGSVVNSSIFGFAYQIKNATGSPQAVYGMITQGAFEDEFSVPIINASTTYSVRITVSALADIISGNLIVDLFSPSLGSALGTFTLPLADIETRMQIFTGTLLTAELAPVPKDLLLRVYATNIPNGATIIIDRVEPFPTEQPNLNTQVIASYQGNYEAFDRLTGPIQTGVQNQQPNRSAFTLFDSLYVVKTGSFLGINDNHTTEPAFWNPPRVISNSVGTLSIYGVTSGIDDPNSGEEWALIFGRSGAYIFNGGEPIRLTEEIQSVIDMVNWKYGHTTWIKNDITKRRILIGVPLKTHTLDSQGNIVRPLWFPEGVIPDDANPITPNVILECYYGQLNTANALADRVGVHQSYSGKLISSEVTRKWSIWTIKAPAAAFLKRPDNTLPVFLGNSDLNGKVFELVDGLREDDGSPFAQLYIPYCFADSQSSEARGLNVLRMAFEYMTMVIDGTGNLTITAFPNDLTSIYTHTVDPPLTLPASDNGDVEIPLNETASRLFLQFGTQCVGAGFILSRIVMVMRQDPWAPVRGIQ